MIEKNVIKADTALTHRYILIVVVVVVLGFLMLFTVGDPVDYVVDAYLGDIKELQKTNPTQANHKVKLLILSGTVALWFLGVLVIGWFLYVASKMWRAEQWPPPGTRVAWDTKIWRGKLLKLRAGLGIIFLVVTFGFLTYEAYELSSFVLNDFSEADKQLQPMPKAAADFRRWAD